MNEAQTNDHSDIGFVPDTGEDHSDIGFVPDKSLSEKALNVVGKVAKKVDAYGGDASTRAAIFAAQQGKNPIQAAVDQYGNSDTAPTGKMIAMKAGVPDTKLGETGKKVVSALAHVIEPQISPAQDDYLQNITPADAAGAVVDFTASPANLLPGGKYIVKAGSKLADYIAKLPMMQKAGEALDAAGRGAAKVGSALTGLPQKSIQTYATEAPVIRQMAKDSGTNAAIATDQVRSKFQDSIQATRTEANAAIKEGKLAASTTQNVSIKPIIANLEKMKKRLDPSLEAEDIASIEGFQERLNEAATAGKVSPAQMIPVTKFLQKRGRYDAAAIFNVGSDAQQAATSAAQKARTIRNKAIPEIAEPYSDLSELRTLQKDPSYKNTMVAGQGRPLDALRNAGSGLGGKESLYLQKMGAATGTDMLHEAEKLRTMQDLGSYKTTSLLPVDTTGKSFTRMAVGKMVAGPVGAAVSHALGAGPALSGAVGTTLEAMVSPAALKLAIDAGRAPRAIVQKLAGTVGKLDNAAYRKAFAAIKTVSGQRIIKSFDQQVTPAQPDYYDDENLTPIERRLKYGE